MPYDSQGNFTRLHNWESDRQNNIEIMSDRHDEEDDNFSEALNKCMLRDGRAPLEGNLNAGNHQIKNIAQGTLYNDAVTLEQANKMKEDTIKELHNSISSVYSIGDIKPSLQKLEHKGWVLCDGRPIDRQLYSELFSLIGVSFGSGDGVKTFNVPDYRGKFLRGLGGNSAPNMHTFQDEGLPNIVGKLENAMVYTNQEPVVTGAFASEKQGNGSTSSQGETSRTNLKLDASRSSKVYGASDHVTPVNYAVNWFIKAKGD